MTEEMNATEKSPSPTIPDSPDVDIVSLDENNLAEFADFFSRSKNLPPDSPAVLPSYLKWKYLNPLAPQNCCLALRKNGALCAVVGAAVWPCEVGGQVTDICFPGDWYSAPNNPIKGAGRKIMRELMERYPASVAVGGSKMCYEPQIKVGFRDVGHVPLLIVDKPLNGSLKDFVKYLRNWILHPVIMWNRIRRIGNKPEQNTFNWEVVRLDRDELCRHPGHSLLSRGISRPALIQRWEYFTQQPVNPSHILRIKKRGSESFAIICQLTDSREGFYGLGDALIHPEHTQEDILIAAAHYARRQGGGILLMTNLPSVCKIARGLGYRTMMHFRTQYFSLPGGPSCDRIETLPTVSLISHDELSYIEAPQNRTRCNACHAGVP